MGFVQIIQFETSKFEEMQEVGREWEAAAGTESRARRRVLCRDRAHPDKYVNIVFFDSHEDAMENSDMAVTQEFSQKMMALADGPPTFVDLDIIEDVSY